MSSVPYSAVSWQPNEIISDDKMSQFASNLQYVKDNTPRSVYADSSSGLKRSQGIVILGGSIIITPRASDRAQVNVNFGSTFATGCEPIITTGMVNNFYTQVFVRLSGIGRPKPNHNGFEAHVRVASDKEKQDTISGNIYVNYMALGYK